MTDLRVSVKIIPLIAWILLTAYAVRSQTGPVCNTPSNGSAWTLIGPNALPELGPGVRFSMTGTGAQMRLKFQDIDQPNPKILYAATPTGGLFRTWDVTVETPVWYNITDSTRLPVLGVRDMEFMPGNDSTLFVGTGIRYPLDLRRMYGIGLLKTTDSGRTWNRTGLQFNPPGKWEEICHDVLIDPADTNVIHVLCGPFYYKSTDGGARFARKKLHTHPCPAGWGATFRDIECKPGDSRVLYLSSDASYFYFSKDGGENWEEHDVREWGVPAEVERMDIVVSKQDSNLVYLACRTREGEVILRSRDAAANWEIVFQKKLRTSYEKHSIALSPNHDSVLYVGGLYIDRVIIDSTRKRSIAISSGIHLDHRDLLVVDDGKGGDIIYSANDGGLYEGKLIEGRWEWRDVSGTGMNNTQFYGIAASEDRSVILGGTQDNGVLLSHGTGTFIKPNIGGDGSDCAVDPYDPNRVYGTYWALTPTRIRVSTDKGLTYGQTLRKGMEDDPDTYFFPIIAHEDGNLYSATRNVYRLPRGTDTWEQIGELNLSTELPYKVTSMSIAPSDPAIIYAYGGELFKTTNATSAEPEWVNISDGLGFVMRPSEGGEVISCVESAAGEPDKVWVGFRSFDSEYKVYVSVNGGRTWENMSRGLPPFPVNDLAFQAGTEDVLYAGTDVGVYYNPNASDPDSEWRCFNSGLPVCMVADLEVNYCTGTLLAGTFGRSIWESPFATASNFRPLEVSENTTWDFKILRSDVVVGRGSELVLRGEIRCAPGVTITVEKNARLVLDGAHIDALCGEKWQGIVVEEDLNIFERIFGTDKGELMMRNGATVENTQLKIPGV